MARYPAPGRVKTRLAVALGPDAAAAVSRAFILDLHDRLRAHGVPTTWAFWPPDAEFAAILPGAACHPQRGRDLGERMANAAGGALAAGATSAILLGSDVPHVSLAALDDACRALADSADVVLGPARDGGYYLLGMRRVEPTLFEDIAWGSRDVSATTRARITAAGLRLHLLPESFDVDDVDDLHSLGTLITTGVVSLPRTGAMLGQLPPERRR